MRLTVCVPGGALSRCARVRDLAGALYRPFMKSSHAERATHHPTDEALTHELTARFATLSPKTAWA